MKRVIITGGTGFIGSNLIRRLLHDGHEVHLFIRRNAKRWRIQQILNDVYIHNVDIRDRANISSMICALKADWVFHLAVYGAYSSQTDLYQMAETNFIGTINLVEACLKAGFEAIVNTGSSSEYGFKDHPPSEKEWLEPNSYYAVTKAAATQYCRYTAQSRNVPIVTLRLYSAYGPYEEPARLMPTLIMQGLNGKLPPLVNPEVARDYVYIEDVVEAYILAATQAGQEAGAVYNVGTGIQTTLREVVDVARKVLKIPMEPKWESMPKRIWDTSIWVSDNHKIREELCWQPRYTFEEGFRQMVDWFRENPIVHSIYRQHENS